MIIQRVYSLPSSIHLMARSIRPGGSATLTHLHLDSENWGQTRSGQFHDYIMGPHFSPSLARLLQHCRRALFRWNRIKTDTIKQKRMNLMMRLLSLLLRVFVNRHIKTTAVSQSLEALASVLFIPKSSLRAAWGPGFQCTAPH